VAKRLSRQPLGSIGGFMNPSYARIRLPMDDALSRFSQWITLPELSPPQKVKGIETVEKACKNGVWRSVVAVSVYESGKWTVFEDLTGHLASFSADQWLEFAHRDELVFAGYNDTIPYGQVIAIKSGRVLREFLDDQQDSQKNVNHGQLDFETKSPIKDWIGAASFVDEDKIVLYPNEVLLWMFGAAT
jgi:hypothetical protein